MSTPKQRKDMVASDLLSMGVNKTAIIAILCNAVTESAHTFDPKLTEYGRAIIFSNSYALGCGIWQWSYPSNGNKEVYDYARSHSEADAIKMQCHKLVSEPGQWIARGYPADMSFDEFLHNKKNRTWQELTRAWCIGWERPNHMYAQSYARINNYSWIQPINWGSSAGGNGTDSANDNHGNQKHPLKMLSMSECLSLINKLKHGNTDGQQHNNNQAPGSGASNNFDINLTESEFNAHVGLTVYEMNGLRAHVWTDWKYSDCSAFVSRMVIDGWHLNQDKGKLFTTETLHGFLKSIGYHLVDASYSTDRPAKAPGDVYIMGEIGHSLGGMGHALISLDGKGMWECQGSVTPALRHTATTSAALKWDAYNWNPLIYHYTKS